MSYLVSHDIFFDYIRSTAAPMVAHRNRSLGDDYDGVRALAGQF